MQDEDKDGAGHDENSEISKMTAPKWKQRTSSNRPGTETATILKALPKWRISSKSKTYEKLCPVPSSVRKRNIGPRVQSLHHRIHLVLSTFNASMTCPHDTGNPSCASFNTDSQQPILLQHGLRNRHCDSMATDEPTAACPGSEHGEQHQRFSWTAIRNSGEEPTRSPACSTRAQATGKGSLDFLPDGS